MDGGLVGLANLARIDPAARRCEWAYYLGEASTRGRGVGSQVEYIVLRHVFEDLGLNKLWCEVLVENEAVWKLHGSFGFVREALFRDHVQKAGRFQDVVGLGMLKADWDGARPIEGPARQGPGPRRDPARALDPRLAADVGEVRAAPDERPHLVRRERRLGRIERLIDRGHEGEVVGGVDGPADGPFVHRRVQPREPNRSGRLRMPQVTCSCSSGEAASRPARRIASAVTTSTSSPLGQPCGSYRLLV